MKNNFARRPAAIVTMLLISFALPCCKKNSGTGNSTSNGSGYYMKFKLNGVQLEYDSQPFASFSFSKSDSLYTGVLAAYEDVNKGLANAVTITIFSNSAIAAGGSFDDPAKAREGNGDILPQSTLIFYDSTAIGYLTMGSLADANGNIPLPGVVANARLTITDMTSSYVKGTFSGTVYKSSSLTQLYKITEGAFYLKRS